MKTTGASCSVWKQFALLSKSSNSCICVLPSSLMRKLWSEQLWRLGNVSLNCMWRESFPFSVNRSPASRAARKGCRATQRLMSAVITRINLRILRIPTWNNSLQENLVHPLSAAATDWHLCSECTDSQTSLCWLISKSCELATSPILCNRSCPCSYNMVNKK